MKSYNEIAKSVLKRRDEHIAKQKKRRKIIINTVTSVLGCFIVFMMSFWLYDMGIIQFDSNKSEYSEKDISNTNDIPPSTDPDNDSKLSITSLDQLNFYAAKKAIAQECASGLLSDVRTANNNGIGFMGLSASPKQDIDPASAFTITMFSYFTADISDSKGFLAAQLGGTGLVEVVVTHNSFNNMITFKSGDNYYSCLQTAETENTMSFSSYRYVSGFQLVENYDRENYEFIVYFEEDRIIGINCRRYESQINSYAYVADDLKMTDSFSFVMRKKQSFTIEQLEDVFSLNNSETNEGIVLNEGTVIFGESVVSKNAIAFINNSGETIMLNKNIKKIIAMKNEKYGYCIRLDLATGNTMSGKINAGFYVNKAEVRTLTLQGEGSSVYIVELNNKSRMSDVFYKLTSNDGGNKIGKITTYDTFVKEMSRKINLGDYWEILTSTNVEGDFRECFYEYHLKYDKNIEYNPSNYDVTIDGITVTLPIKVSDFIAMGFTVLFQDDYGPNFLSPAGNKVYAYIMSLDGNSADFLDKYIAQLSFECYETSNKYQEGKSPVCPDFEMIEGLNVNSTLDDIISRLGEPNKMYVSFYEKKTAGYYDCTIQLHYNVSTLAFPNSRFMFNIRPVNNGNTPTDFLISVSLVLQ